MNRAAITCFTTLTALLASCSSKSSSPAPPAVEYAALVRGKLANPADLVAAKAKHDQVAGGGESASKAAGDIAHAVFLGTTILDTAQGDFLAIDRWTDGKAMEAFYADPKVAQGFAGLFAGPPTIQFFKQAPTWVTWGDIHSGEPYSPSYVHLALGVLKDSDTAKNQKAHDAVASGGKQPSIDAGNVAHVVFLGLHDERQFVAVDIWKKSDSIQGFYTNPQFVAAFAPLFESATQPVYSSTDWHQW